MSSGPYDGNYKRAKTQAFARSSGVCQMCGGFSAVSAHHWGLEYPSGAEVTSDDLTALCSICHEIATEMRRFKRTGGDPFKLLSIVKKKLEE